MNLFDLKGLREAAGISQTELGNRINLSQAQISRYEAEPGSATLEIAFAWLAACGSSPEIAPRAFVPARSVGIDAGRPYEGLHRKLSLLEQYIETGPVPSDDLPPLSITPKDLLLKVRQWRRKPTLLLAGRFDSGKTRIANALLGSDNLPSQYTPTTSVVTYVRHEAERPSWQNENVYVMGSGFDPSRWDDKGHCQAHRIVAGHFDTLRMFGTRESRGASMGAKHALVYMDAPLLHACTLIDVPGYSDTQDEECSADGAARMADLLIYTSPAISFLDAADFLHLGLLLRAMLPIHARTSKGMEKYSNLFLVATHAAPTIGKSDLNRILDRGAERMFVQFKDTLFRSRDISQLELRERFKSFWYEDQTRRAGLEQGLHRTLSAVLPAAIEKHVDQEVKEIKAKAKSALSAQIEAYERTLASIDAARHSLMTLRDEEPMHRRRIREKREEVKRYISKLRNESREFVRIDIASMLTAVAIEQVIREHFSEKDVAKQDACAKLLEAAQFKVEEFLKKKSSQLTPVLEGFFREYDVSLDRFGTVDYVDGLGIPFDAQGAFVGGLAGLTALGALGLWASTVGNLGGYILVAKLASVLSVLGLGVGSASLVSFVAAVGGPVTIAIGIAALLTLGGWMLLGESWQSRLAKKIDKLLREKEFLAKVEQAVDTFWEQTWTAFEAGAKEVEKKYGQYIQANEHLLNDEESGSKERIENTIREIEELKDFFAGIPWRVSS
jgi:transcriptional regulator with XRE-family HTH domain